RWRARGGGGARVCPRCEVPAAGDDRARDRQSHRRRAVPALPAPEARAAARVSVALLKERLGEIADFQHAGALADWGSRTFMPPHCAEARADLVATLTRITHERFVADEVGDLLDELEGTEDETDAALVRLTRREWERARHVPAELAAELAHAAGVAVAAWDKAKAASDFASFVPHLERQLE